MLDIFIELCQLYSESITWDGEIKPKTPDQVIADTLGLWMLSFCIGCLIGLIWCEHFANIPEEIKPISVFWRNVTMELGVYQHK